MASNRLLLLIFTTLSFIGIAFHEPWRDEAQAWLVVRSAETFLDILQAASAEATGPLYYFLLWPLAKFFPAMFPFWIKIISFLPLLVAAWTLLKLDLPKLQKFLLLFSFPLFFEYAVTARLYGLGTAFLLLGILFEKKNKPWLAALFFSICASIQLNFLIAVFTWKLCTTPVKHYITKQNLVLFLVVLLSFFHLYMGSADRPWGHPGLQGFYLSKLGSTLGHIFSPSFIQLQLVGLFVFIFGIFTIPSGKRIKFIIGIAPFVALFTFVYGGAASARHAGSLFLVWAVLSCSNAMKLSTWGKRIQTVLLTVSIFFATVAHVRSIQHNTSDGLPAALAAIKARADIKQNINEDIKIIYSSSDMAGFVAAAALNSRLAIGNTEILFPYFAPASKTKHRKAPLPPNTSTPQEGDIYIGQNQDQIPQAPQGYIWKEFYKPTHTLIGDESLGGFILIKNNIIMEISEL